MKEVPLLDLDSCGLGFLSGSLIVGGFLPFGPLPQMVFLLVGVFVLLYDLIPSKKGMYAVTSLIFMVMGGILAFVLFLVGAGLWYLITILILSAFICVKSVTRR